MNTDEKLHLLLHKLRKEYYRARLQESDEQDFLDLLDLVSMTVGSEWRTNDYNGEEPNETIH